jgi:hypothetical protein
MDLFLAGCQGLGLALAAGALLGALAQTDHIGNGLAVVAMALGAFLFGASLTPEDHPAWPGWIVGAPVALLAYVVARDIAVAARRRAGEGSGFGVAFYLGLYALVLTGLALLPVSPVSLLALAGTVWLHFGRRRKAAEKHAGLRSLR